MSDETKIEEEDGEEVEAHAKVPQFKEPSAAEGESDDDNDVEAHAKVPQFKTVSAAEGESDDDVEAHFKVNM